MNSQVSLTCSRTSSSCGRISQGNGFPQGASTHHRSFFRIPHSAEQEKQSWPPSQPAVAIRLSAGYILAGVPYADNPPLRFSQHPASFCCVSAASSCSTSSRIRCDVAILPSRPADAWHSSRQSPCFTQSQQQCVLQSAPVPGDCFAPSGSVHANPGRCIHSPG